MTTLAIDAFIKIISQQLGKDESTIKPESHLQDDLGADSIAMVNIVVEVEDILDTEYEDLDFDNVATVAEAYAKLTQA